MDIEQWGTFPLAANREVQFITAGDLNFWIQRQDDEIWIGHLHSRNLKSENGDNISPPDDLVWSRWAPRDISDAIKIMPVFPDLPMVINSDYPLRVTPDRDIHIFTRIPVWLRISIGKKDAVLTELPTVKLSRTWFGTPMEGELCYWSTTKARRSLQDVEKKPHLVSCPIHITNRTAEDLNFKKFCFRVERLKIFMAGDQLWADETRIVYQGEEQNSDITMSGKLPKGMEKGKLLTPPRKPIQKSLATRTFRKIFDDSFIFGR